MVTIRVPGARASKEVLRGRLTSALIEIAALEAELFGERHMRAEAEQRLLDISNIIFAADVNRHGSCVIALAEARQIATGRPASKQLSIISEDEDHAQP